LFFFKKEPKTVALRGLKGWVSIVLLNVRDSTSKENNNVLALGSIIVGTVKPIYPEQ
jgi:hypothetical protein